MTPLFALLTRCGLVAAALAQGHLACAQGLMPLPMVAGVPFHMNVFGQAATDAAAGRAGQAPKEVPGLPRNVYIPHASVVMWAEANGQARYAAAVALIDLTYPMSTQKCAQQNGGNAAKCVRVFDAKARNIAAVKASDGGFFFATADSRAAARQKALAACQSRAGVTCAVDQVYGESAGLLDL